MAADLRSVRLSHNMAAVLLCSIRLSHNTAAGLCGLSVWYTLWHLQFLSSVTQYDGRSSVLCPSVTQYEGRAAVVYSSVTQYGSWCAVVYPSVTQDGGRSLWSVGLIHNIAVAFLCSVDMLLSDMLGIVVKYLKGVLVHSTLGTICPHQVFHVLSAPAREEIKQSWTAKKPPWLNRALEGKLNTAMVEAERTAAGPQRVIDCL